MDKVFETEIGKIKISENILGQLAKRTIECVQGDAWLCNEKARIIDDNLNMFLSTSIYSQSVTYTIKNDRLYFKLFIICDFGKSLNQITERMIKQLEKDIPKIFQEDLAEIKVVVKGIKSKEIAKKNIEFTEKYGFKG